MSETNKTSTTPTMNSNDELTAIFRKLNKEVNQFEFKGRKPVNICERLPKIYELGNEAKQKKNYTQAYTYFKRWIACVDWLTKQNLKKDIIKKNFSNDKIKDVRNLLQDVSTRIQMEIEAKYKPPEIMDANEIDLTLQLPEAPSDEPQPKENEQITCAELHNILNQGIKSSEKRLLIIDVRTDEDYAESRIAFPENIVHIPAEKIQPNKAPDFYSQLFLNDKEAFNRFAKRSANDTDVIVLVDSNSSLEIMKINSPIAVLNNTFKECDPNIKYKRVAILKGGFEEWIKTYEAFVTDPLRKRISLTPDTSSNSTLDDTGYNYDQLQHNFEASPILSGKHRVGVKVKGPSVSNSQISINNEKNSTNLYTNLLKPFEKKLANSSAKLNSGSNSSSINSSLNRYSSPPLAPSAPAVLPAPSAPPAPTLMTNGNASDRELLRWNNIREAQVIVEKLKPKPPVDRSNKPAALIARKPSTTSLERELTEAETSVELYERRLENGPPLDDWQREQLDTLRKKRQELMELLKRPQSADSKMSNLYPALPNLSTMSLGTKARVARPMKPNLNIEEKENIPMELRVKVEPMKIDQVRPSTPQKMDVDDEEETRKEPLKSESMTISGLKRSYSSPNLVQKGQKEGAKTIPEVNRSLKPSAVSENVNPKRVYSAISSKGKVQRLEPVYSAGLYPGITGLKNLGNSCYMNSIIQCLSNTVYLARYFNDNTYTDDLNRNSDKGGTGYVAEEVAQVIKALWRGQYKSISPRDLKVVIGQYKLQFESYDQQDSHEFLMFLLDWMHNDLKQKTKVSYDRLLTVAEKEWEKSMDGQSSIISKLFFGQLRSTIECLHCEKNSTTYETFNSLTMSLPASNKCTLDECVLKFVSGQQVSGWKCPNCKVPRDGVKKFDIAKLPHIIVIHLNRFGETSGWLEKKNTAVEFPLMDFNLRQYLGQDVELNNATSTSYNLYAMSNHYGTMDGGHYTAYCKSNHQKWYKYDDHTVTEVPPGTVKSQSNSAYLLFYASVKAESYLNS